MFNLILWLLAGHAHGYIALQYSASTSAIMTPECYWQITTLICTYNKYSNNLTVFETAPTSRITLVQAITPKTTLTVMDISSATDTVTTTLPGSAPPKTVGASEVVICPAPTNSISVEPQEIGPNALWGCSPGFICSPPKADHCEIWAGPPNYDYVCDARYCNPSPSITNVLWSAGNTSKYPLTGYFNLNPSLFGLNYSIFVATEVSNVRSRTIESPHDVIKRVRSAVPAVCYTQCNNGYIEAQRLGKSAIICARDSAFQSSYQSCQTCIGANSNITRAALQNIIDPRFAPFVSFCDTQSELINTGGASTETTNPVEAMQSMVIISTILTFNHTLEYKTQSLVLSKGSISHSMVVVPTTTVFGTVILPTLLGSGSTQDTSNASNTSRNSLLLSGSLVILSTLSFLFNH